MSNAPRRKRPTSHLGFDPYAPQRLPRVYAASALLGALLLIYIAYSAF